MLVSKSVFFLPNSYNKELKIIIISDNNNNSLASSMQCLSFYIHLCHVVCVFVVPSFLYCITNLFLVASGTILRSLYTCVHYTILLVVYSVTVKVILLPFSLHL